MAGAQSREDAPEHPHREAGQAEPAGQQAGAGGAWDDVHTTYVHTCSQNAINHHPQPTNPHNPPNIRTCTHKQIRESGLVVAKKRLSAHALAAEGKEAAAAAGAGGAKRHKKLSSGDIGASPYPVVGKMRGGTLFLNRDTVKSVTAKPRGGGGRGRRR